MKYCCDTKNEKKTIRSLSRDEWSDLKMRLLLKRSGDFDTKLHAIGFNEAELVKNDDFFVFEGEGNQYLFSLKKNVAGTRMIVFFSSVHSHEIDQCSFFPLFLKICRKEKCDLVQIEVPVTDSPLRLPNGFFSTNFTFSYQLSEHEGDFPPTERIIKISDTDKTSWAFHEAIDLDVRWQMPGSTVPNLDISHLVHEEYSSINDMIKLGHIGYAKAKDNSSFILWFKSPKTLIGIVMLLYVDKLFRGQGYGESLLKEALSDCASCGVKELRYFVSSHNINAIKTLTKTGFALQSAIGNRVI